MARLDEITISHKGITLRELKTRKSNRPPSDTQLRKDRLQLLLYCFLFKGFAGTLSPQGETDPSGLQLQQQPSYLA